MTVVTVESLLRELGGERNGTGHFDRCTRSLGA